MSSQHLSTHPFDALACFSHGRPCAWACVCVCLHVWESVVPPVLLLNLPGSEIDGWHRPLLACHSAVYHMHPVTLFRVKCGLQFLEEHRLLTFALSTFWRGICCSKEATVQTEKLLIQILDGKSFTHGSDTSSWRHTLIHEISSPSRRAGASWWTTELMATC